MGDEASVVRLQTSRTRSSSSLVFIQSKLRRLSTQSSSPSTQTTLSNTESKGPLGLSLLHEPSEPRIDFIFIHGLGGSSRKTWCHSSEAGMFWPKDWLPNEAGFRHVRLHSYGYNAAWRDKKEGRQTVHDFAQAFLADMHNSPHLRRNGQTPIVIVAHSMGGLIAKKAYLLATRDPTYADVANRIHSMYFLATPHRGADSAQLAKMVIAVSSSGTKAFLDDLLPGSGTLDAINDEFRNACSNLQLWSFYEGLAMKMGFTSSVVVSKESAVIGLPGERKQYLEADHRHICKFESPTDPNYLILQRSFMTTIEALETDVVFQRRDEYRSQLKLVTSILGVDRSPDADLLAITEKQHPGSCQWLTEHQVFQDWTQDVIDREAVSPTQELPELTPQILWLNGRPGTGKSVAAAHVVRHLQACNLDCSFYFFRHNDNSRSTVSGLLRSLAFQMAEVNFEIRHSIVSMSEDEERVSKDDHHILWNKLFVNRIFKLKTMKPQFWVIDALDECSNKSVAAFIQILSQLDSSIPLRVFVTSRPGGHIQRLFAQEKISFLEINTGHEGSLKDIELFLRAKCPQVRDTTSYQHLVSDVLSKSNGIFLWASLTMTRLGDAYSVTDIQDVLREIPVEMNDLYTRIISAIAESPSAEIARCVLKWAICSPTFLTMPEIEAALKLDIDRTLTASPSQLEAMCGHLISVKNSRVEVTHQTISAFLTQQNTDLSINRPLSHSRLAEICLTLLCGKDLAPPRTRRVEIANVANQSPLLEYACRHYSHHLMHSSSSVDAPLILLDKFLRSNVLTWIERLARGGDLSALLQTVQRLKAYLRRRAKYRSPLGTEVQNVEAWVGDLAHLVAVFGAQLLDSPSSIHFLVPYLCPPTSVINTQFAKPSRRLKLVGAFDQEWNDRLTCFLYPTNALSFACGDRFVAIGLASGEVKVYGSDTFDAVTTLDHGQSVRNLVFSNSQSLLATCSARRLRLWSSPCWDKQACLWQADLDFIAFDMTFSSDDAHVMLPNRGSTIAIFGAETGAREADIQLFAFSDSDSSDGEDQAVRWTPPSRIRLDSTQKLAALSYRNAAITLWDVDKNEKLGVFEKEGFEDSYSSPQALDMIFNPIPDLELLAIAYKDGDIVACNPWTMEQVCIQEQSVDILAATSDGRILAGGDAFGDVHIFSFETLHPLYRISSLVDQIRQITFSFNNLRFFDIRGQFCNVWEPFVLIPKDGSDDNSSFHQSEEIISKEVSISEATKFEWGNAITTTAETFDGKYLFAGRQDGVIDIYDLSTGTITDKLRFHTMMLDIKQLDWNDAENLLLSVDSGNCCILSQLSLAADTGQWKHRRMFEHQDFGIISGALVGPGGLSLLCNAFSAKLMTSAGAVVREVACDSACQWMPHPTDSKYLLRSQGAEMEILGWSDLKQLEQVDGSSILVHQNELGVDSPTEDNVTEWVSRQGSNHAVGWSRQAKGSSAKARGNVGAINISNITFDASSSTSMSLAAFTLLNVKTIIALVKSTLYFLDSKGWICSVSLRSSTREPAFYTRHFFIPLTWHTGGTDALIQIVSKHTVVFGRGDELIIFHGFLDFEEKVQFEKHTVAVGKQQ